MQTNTKVNGSPSNQVSTHDRGLLYGDGVFRTMRVSAGRVLCWQLHYKKLHHDCAALGIVCPESTLLAQELQSLLQQYPDGVAKIIITRGLQSERGYRPSSASLPTRIISISPPPQFSDKFGVEGIKIRVCQTRLAHQPRLAGLKHLNRLENIMAAAEWDDAQIAEGVMLDLAGNVIEGMRSNIFAVRAGQIHTPDLTHCGVAGVQRDRVIDWAAKNNVPCKIELFSLTELIAADEIFLINSVVGLWPVREFVDQNGQNETWSQFPMSKQIQKWLNSADA